MNDKLQSAFQIACAVAFAVFGFIAVLFFAVLQFALPVAAIIAILYAVKHFFF